ncbi:3-deoxy-manno-octulosonate cytidylyltransferase [Desulfurobacterium thermolithotrophum DSM 11699]|uniref:3-deoxy-manno-octulosonate cytidylyltransferase n=1 Tax=Desulfurobacterium thermolithotrophum (strain DSM 11699 / BSA) TaxID=868864 RepID=F0S3E7_DESTD|nr:3-deoxy-manno-octulosonate cytidylyltransferase [Desulfurobacterium thermolithotrophum]ADY73369.1 3-deoxy-manno-octulosonate cytidylyltransferase [Desulfurobacterium thermolithotrophum DSM 11699]
MKKFLIAIPARIKSNRLPEKPLRLLCGKPLIAWVVESCLKITENVLVATDDLRVKKIAEKFGAKAVMTSPSHPSGTDRIFEAVKDLEFEYIVNVQGDEPFVKADHVLPIVGALQKGEEYATIAVRFNNEEEILNPNNVKVVVDKHNHAIYFSRNVIPYPRDGRIQIGNYLKHIGIYGYTKNSLQKFVSWNEGFLERIEKLEQLRIIENGKKIYVSVVSEGSFGIDTEEDLKKAAEKLERGEV